MKMLTKKVFMVIVSAALLLTFAVSGTVAYLVDASDPVVNEFTPTSVKVEIPENFKNNVKENVKIKNTSDIKAYVRATYIVTWQTTDSSGIKQMLPADTDDYELNLNTSGWVVANGMYYWPTPLDAQAETGVLITSCKVKDGVQPPAEGYYLNVEIIAQAIQAEPTTAVVEAWKVTLNGTTITGVQ